MLAPPGPVDDLVGHDDDARTEPGLSEPTAQGEDLPDPDRAQRPQVRAVVDPVRLEPVALAMAGEKRDAPPLEVTDNDVVAGRSERRVHGDALGVGEELVEA